MSKLVLLRPSNLNKLSSLSPRFKLRRNVLGSLANKHGKPKKKRCNDWRLSSGSNRRVVGCNASNSVNSVVPNSSASKSLLQVRDLERRVRNLKPQVVSRAQARVKVLALD